MRIRKSTAAVGSALMAASMLAAGPALADGGHQTTPLHGHMLVLGIQFDGDTPVGFRKCVDVASSKALKLNAHHDHLHTGRAGEALFAAGHLAVPTAPITAWANCAELEAWFYSMAN
jgi:hypothetical protein